MTGTQPHDSPRLPLEGLIVADFSRVLAGPLATMTLADLGARVIKVERPGKGDDTRQWGPPFSATGSTYFESVNRNKESICLDLNDAADLAVATDLALRADILIENFKSGRMKQLGLDYDTLSQQNPGLIYASISGFGSGTGADLPGYDFMVQALGGLMSITGEETGSPTKVGVAVVDILTAKDATIGILAALHSRETSGLGRLLEVNLLSSLQGALANQGQAYLGGGVVPSRMGNAHPSIAPYELLNCADKPLAVACGNDRQFASILSVLGLDTLLRDERFLNNRARVQNRPELVAALESRLTTGTASQWQSALTAAGVPAGQVGTIADGIELARGLDLAPTIDVQDASGQTRGTQIRNPITWSPSVTPRTAAPPALGEHNDSVREWLSHLYAAQG
ncbi:CaiB/BaiF CoA transferase family protein [Cryobacterium psychrophilum]|uniref:CoA transferase n=1 Tax=Cryobacterium psychrophilum TaxID=41988 RepID=A0A4Y8KTB5_9MICO|nr:CoA transferase [Cryobacterium psychrophilum]TDW28771.1 crotonobetainyl-CoA:carnitine CoA-transferase CaiB-like acyl-CoA transferase [Cryobacterium psychrophilum]TFD82422.1 CoA transferase [Cryobacterium psychrophilum]